MRLPIPSSALVKRSFFYDGLKLYNHLPNELKELPTRGLFRKHLKNLLVGKAYYGLDEFYGDSF